MPLYTKILKKVTVAGSRVYTVVLPELGLGLKSEAGAVVQVPAESVGGDEPDGQGSTGSGRQERSPQEEARRIVEEAERKAAQICEEAEQRGWEKGYQEGMRCAAGEKAKLLAELQVQQRKVVASMAEAGRRRRENMRQAEKQLAELALIIAETLVKQQLEIAPETVLELAKKGIARLLDNGQVQKIKLQLSPDDESFCRDNLSSLEEKLPSGANIELFADPALSRGSCRLETEDGIVELLLDEELNDLGQLFEELRL